MNRKTALALADEIRIMHPDVIVRTTYRSPGEWVVTVNGEAK